MKYQEILLQEYLDALTRLMILSQQAASILISFFSIIKKDRPKKALCDTSLAVAVLDWIKKVY
jgi:hypothetical protein